MRVAVTCCPRTPSAADVAARRQQADDAGGQFVAAQITGVVLERDHEAPWLPQAT